MGEREGHECCAEKLEAKLEAVHASQIRMEQKAKSSWDPAAKQTWDNKEDLDGAKGAFRALLVLVSVLTLITTILGLLQVARALGA